MISLARFGGPLAEMTIAGDRVAAATRYRTIVWLALSLFLVHWVAPQPGTYGAAVGTGERALSIAGPRSALRQSVARSPTLELRRPRIDRGGRLVNRQPSALPAQQAVPLPASARASPLNVDLVGQLPSFLRIYYSRAPPSKTLA
jgi:hypothetical protein